MRSIPFFFFTAALVAVSGPSKAAPRNIGECEKIQAADAYNLCLASFGPVARGHHAYADGAGVGKQDAAQDAASEESSQMDAAVEHGRRHHRHAFKHANRHQHWAKHGGSFHKRAISQRSRHGGKTRMALSITPGRSRLR